MTSQEVMWSGTSDIPKVGIGMAWTQPILLLIK